ncbi:hypothetical protein [Halarchaeum grantii]|nr:hypothetical protein [Halarchaeum grantii]
MAGVSILHDDDETATRVLRALQQTLASGTSHVRNDIISSVRAARRRGEADTGRATCLAIDIGVDGTLQHDYTHVRPLDEISFADFHEPVILVVPVETREVGAALEEAVRDARAT